MADVLTKLSNLVDPEVIGDMIREKLVDKITFSPLAKVDRTLEGRPGSTITLPKFAYIGDAKEVDEGADIEESLLSATTIDVTIKKIAKGVRISDEALLSAYGDPMGEAARQIATAMAAKIDADCATSLAGIKAAMTFDVSATSIIAADVVIDALVKFGEDLDGSKALLIAPTQLAQIRKDPNYINGSEIATNTMLAGAIGRIWGCDVIVSNKIKAATGKFTNFIVKPEALAIYLKRDVLTESERRIKNETTFVKASQLYVAHLLDESKAIKVITKETAATV